jgi:hypothetical protein
MSILEVIYEYHGLWTPGALCGLQIFSNTTEIPTIVLSELPCNHNTSVTNLVECIAAEVLQKYLPEQIGKDTPFHCVEHYPREVQSKLPATFDIVTFERSVPFFSWVGRTYRISLGEPQWRPLEPSELERMIECSYPDPLAISTRARDFGSPAAWGWTAS